MGVGTSLNLEVLQSCARNNKTTIDNSNYTFRKRNAYIIGETQTFLMQLPQVKTWE